MCSRSAWPTHQVQGWPSLYRDTLSQKQNNTQIAKIKLKLENYVWIMFIPQGFLFFPQKSEVHCRVKAVF